MIQRLQFAALPLALVGLGLVGCAAPASDPALQAKRDEFKRTIPKCSSEKECTAMWEMAQLWIVKNAGYKLQTTTSVLLETYNSVDASTAMAARVTKEPLGGGAYEFKANVWCANWLGCELDPLTALLDFNRTVGAVKP